MGALPVACGRHVEQRKRMLACGRVISARALQIKARAIGHSGYRDHPIAIVPGGSHGLAVSTSPDYG